MSDSHGDSRSVHQAIKLIGNVDFWLHAGDHSHDAKWLQEETCAQVISVIGNCDGHSGAKPDEFIEMPNCRIWLTHGHRYHVREGRDDLLYWARQFKAQIAIYGHTHIPDIYWDQDLLLFNPGSVSRPRGGSGASCGLITVSAGLQIAPVILELPD